MDKYKDSKVKFAQKTIKMISSMQDLEPRKQAKNKFEIKPEMLTRLVFTLKPAQFEQGEFVL